MKTFEGAEVAPIDEILERTHYVKVLRAEIEQLRLWAEMGERWEPGSGAEAHTVQIEQENEHLRRLNEQLADERDKLRRQLAEAQRWQRKGSREMTEQQIADLVQQIADEPSAWPTERHMVEAAIRQTVDIMVGDDPPRRALLNAYTEVIHRCNELEAERDRLQRIIDHLRVAGVIE